MLCSSQLWTRNGHCSNKFSGWKKLWASRWSSHHHRQWEIPVSRSPTPTCHAWSWSMWYPRNHLCKHHEMWRWHPQGSLRKHCSIWWIIHVSRNRRAHAKRDHYSRPIHHEDQSHSSTREEVFGLDWRFNFSFFIYFPADVDKQARIWWNWSCYCSPQVFLDFTQYLWSISRLYPVFIKWF